MAALKEIPVTIIVSGRNSSTTLRSCLESLAGQDYPIGEILCFDNRSTDDSREIAHAVAESSSVPIHVIDGGEGGTLSTSYNKGAQMAKCDIIVLSHSDCMIPSSGELRKLITPLVSDPSASAAYPIQLMPREVWRKFPFWQKFLFASAVDRVGHMRCAMFDAVGRDLYLKAGGFNEKRFTSTCGYGGEDNDAQVRFSKYGKQLFTEARVVHLHAFSAGFVFRSYLGTRALLARTYGKQLRWQRGLVEFSNLYFFVRPFLAALPFVACIPFAFGLCRWGVGSMIAAIGLQLMFSILVSRKMYRYRETLLDPRILLVLPATWFMIYYETFWFFQGMFTPYADEGMSEGKDT